MQATVMQRRAIGAAMFGVAALVGADIVHSQWISSPALYCPIAMVIGGMISTGQPVRRGVDPAGQ